MYTLNIRLAYNLWLYIPSNLAIIFTNIQMSEKLIRLLVKWYRPLVQFGLSIGKCYNNKFPIIRLYYHG